MSLTIYPDDITAGEVTLGDLAPLAAFSYIGNETAASATPTAVKMVGIPGLTSTATAAGTTTLTNLSKGIQVFTGATTQTITLPVVTTLPIVGFGYQIVNQSTGSLTVNSSGANLVQTITAGSSAFIFAVLLTGTSAASWGVNYVPAVTQSLTNGDTRPVSSDAVFDGLALKAPIDSPTFTGTPTIPSTTGNFAVGNVLGVANNYYIGPISGANAPLLDAILPAVTRWRSAADATSRVWHSNIAGLSYVSGSNVTTVSTTPAAITGLSSTLIASRVYEGELVVYCSAATAADGFRFDFDGGNATATTFIAMGTIADTVSVRPLARTAALATDLVDAVTTGSAIAIIKFTIIVNGAGTFIPRVAKSTDAAGATNTVSIGSCMTMVDIT